MAFWYDGQLYQEGAAGTAANSVVNGPTETPVENPVEKAGSSQTAQVPLDNSGLRFGATVFTTLRVYEGSLQHPLTQWQAHCDRINHSLQQFQWSRPNWADIHTGCQQLKQEHPVLRITVFPDGREWITGRPLPEQRMETTPQGIACWVAPPTYNRSLPTHKTGNYLACWLARQQAQRCGAHEAILTNAQGDWIETATGNLWGWKRGSSQKEGGWYSPAGDHCLPGIMRRKLESILVASHQPVHRQSWDHLDPADFEALAYSNCAVGLLPIHTITAGTTTLKYDPNHASIKALQHLLTIC